MLKSIFNRSNINAAVQLLMGEGAGKQKSYKYDLKAPELMTGVLPKGVKPGAAAIAMDNAAYNYAGIGFGSCEFAGFPGYPYLAMLATRAEYRAFATSLSTELTREWITLSSSETDDDSTKEKLTELTQAIKDAGLQNIMRRAGEHDSYYGRAQIFIDIEGQQRDLPLVLSPKTVKKGAKIRFTNVEPIWTTPVAYNALDPAAPDFYKPNKWFMLGQPVHASRLMTIITREVPDILKPAFNFSGISLSQLAEPYVDNWLRTRQSVADLINNFSITALKTSMDQVLQGTGDPTIDGAAAGDLFARAKLFTMTRSNKGLMLLDNDREDLVKIDTSLAGLYELQAQAQEHMCSVSRQPAIILTGISPSGLNASSDGEIRCWYDWIAALQEAFYRQPIETAVKLLQLSMYGEIDEDIIVNFQPLYQMTPKELAEIRKYDADAAAIYIQNGSVSGEEDRERLARDPLSNYQGLDMGEVSEDEE